MTNFLVILVWIISGAIIPVYNIYKEWENGYPIYVIEICAVLVSFFLGPIVPVIALIAWVISNSNTVVIKAKTHE
ncbi:MAG: hypothetical protein P4L79_09965 [Legionella sp.]|uniref:hypothetical protein n=1 Tax=Legionella sp. TaxID=459 RepID=UPI0028410DDD|nr:hypothetical protein [Legionella sp.]